MKVVKIETFKTDNKDKDATEKIIAEYLNDGWIIEAMTFVPFDGYAFVFSKEE